MNKKKVRKKFKKQIVKKQKAEMLKKLKEYSSKVYVVLLKNLIGIVGIIISIVSLRITFLVREDTAELSKFSDKPIYYTINLYPNENTNYVKVYDKYIRANLTLIVDDFKINKENFLDVNYNSVFTRTKYYMVYDYDLQSKKYNYKCEQLDDRTVAKLRLEDQLHVELSELNFSLTPNKNYCYLLIYTETMSQKNLDLIFFKYYEDDFKIDMIEKDDKVKVAIERIDKDTNICKDYYTNLWSEKDIKRKEDIEFMFDVYEDLKGKMSDTL